VWDLRWNVNTDPIQNRRQPDFNIYNELAANADGEGYDNIVRMGGYGENPWIISEHPEDSHPHWSSDAKMLVFDSAHMGDRKHRIYLQPNSKERQEVPPMVYQAWELFGRYPIFLADGRIAYNGCNWWENGGVCGVYVVDVHGGKPENSSSWPGDIPTDNQGSQILMMSDRAGSWDVYVMNADGSGLRQLTDSPARDGLGTVSPDGNYIAFVTDRDGTWSIYIMRPNGSDQRKLIDLHGGFGAGEYDWIEERMSWGR
jgi:Tol biopolymer transport system component